MPVLNIINDNKKIEETSKLRKTFSNEKVGGYIGIGGNGGVKQGFEKRVMRLYLARVEVLNIGFLLFSKPCSLPFYTTVASDSYIHQLSR